VGGIAPSRRPDLARLGLRALLSGNIATMLSGAVAGLYV
jgi:concentrative nucleoside transporter, CNT family